MLSTISAYLDVLDLHASSDALQTLDMQSREGTIFLCPRPLRQGIAQDYPIDFPIADRENEPEESRIRCTAKSKSVGNFNIQDGRIPLPSLKESPCIRTLAALVGKLKCLVACGEVGGLLRPGLDQAALCA